MLRKKNILLFAFSVIIYLTTEAQCPGSGNNPCSAVPITVNGACVAMSNANCTNFTNPGTCNSGAYRDVWGRFTVGAETEITITWVSTLSRDGVIHLYHLPTGGNCANIGDFIEIACSDDYGSVLGVMESISVSLVPGETYYIRGQRYNSNLSIGAATMCVTGAPQPDCYWSLCLSDSYGDGWNGGSVHVYSDGYSVGTWTLSNGSGPDCHNIPVYIGSDIYIDYTAGSWSTENEYTLFDSYGNVAYSDGTDGTTPADYTFVAADCDPHPVTPNEQDCPGAIPICGDSYSTTNSYAGVGNIPGEINGSNSCLANGERNDVWYVFTVQQNGNLMFTISPNDPADDYDWAVYNITSSSCSDIATDPSLEVSCNYSGTAGDTGPDGSTTFSSQGSAGTPFNAAIPVLQGEVFVINVSNWSSTQNGYFIDFSMASGVIVDVTPPALDTIINTPTCGQNQLTFWFTELVDTSSVNAGDFTVTGPGGTYNVITIAGTSGSQNDREYLLTLDSQLIAGGTYTLTFSGQVDDACGNYVIGNSLDFDVVGIIGSVIVVDGSVVCYDDAVGSATASATGGSGTYSYLWETGSTNATITNLIAGSYDVTISDDVGVCYDIVTAVVNPSNPLVPTGTWAGTTSSDWYDCSNWGGGYVPLSSTDVTIPGGCPNYPLFSVNTTINTGIGICNSIQIQNGGSFTIDNDKDLIINNSLVRVETGGNLNVDNDIEITAGGTLNQNGGDITINGDFINDANFMSSGGTVSFTDNSIQSIDGSQISTFSNVTVNNSGDGLKLDIDAVVNGNLTLTDGDFDLLDNELDLGSTGMLVNETAAARIKATDGSGFPVPGPGTIKATRNNPSGNTAGLGLIITPSASLGNTVIVRGHDELNGSGTFTGNTSILRYYEITPGAKSVTPCDFTFNYFDSELNGHTDGTLVMFQEVQMTYGGFPGAIYWTPLPTINNDIANTAVASSIDNNLSVIKVTLSSSNAPLPVELVDFKAECSDNLIQLSWITASEMNNDCFIIDKSFDGLLFEQIAVVQGAGNSNQTLFYSYTDTNKDDRTEYYRISQKDFDGNYEMLKTIAANCESSSEFSISVIPYGRHNYILITNGCRDNVLFYYITDQLGRVLGQSHGELNSHENMISLESFKPGIYNLVVVCGDQVVVEKIVN